MIYQTEGCLKKPAGLLCQQPQLPTPATALKLIAKLEKQLLPRRVKRLRSVLAKRSRHAVFVFEKTVDPHNCSAALRSLDACSFQEAHLVQAGKRLWFEEESAMPDQTPNRPCPQKTKSKELSSGITQGSNRWLNLYWWQDINSVATYLKNQGYQILVSQVLTRPPSNELKARAKPDLPAVSLPELELSMPMALVFGNEHEGVSSATLAVADGYFSLPMYGFAASYNLSVSVALTAYHIRHAFPQHPPLLDDQTATQIYAAWLARIIKTGALPEAS